MNVKSDHLKQQCMQNPLEIHCQKLGTHQIQ